MGRILKALPPYADWELLHPQMTAQHLGYIPGFLRTDDERPASQQINERYVAGWSSFGKGEWKLGEDNSLSYPDDPPYPPLAQCRLRDELIVFYDHSWVAIIQPDRSFDVARLD